MGVVYALLNVRSPAPPIVALLGLLCILVGEQVPPLIRSALQSRPASHSWRHQVHPHVFGQLPRGGAGDERQLARATQQPEAGTASSKD